jgi:hypothetical protein
MSSIDSIGGIFAPYLVFQFRGVYWLRIFPAPDASPPRLAQRVIGWVNGVDCATIFRIQHVTLSPSAALRIKSAKGLRGRGDPSQMLQRCCWASMTLGDAGFHDVGSLLKADG